MKFAGNVYVARMFALVKNEGFHHEVEHDVIDLDLVRNNL